MSTVALDVDAVRARYSALQRPLAFFDGPGGTQVPDEVIEAIARYYRESNANVSGPYETSRRTEALVAQARLAAADFLGGAPAEDVSAIELDAPLDHLFLGLDRWHTKHG